MYEHSPLCKTLFANAERLAGKTAVVVSGKEVSYAEVAGKVRSSATVLKSLGVSVGDKIILSAQKDVEFIYLYLATQLIGAINVIVDAESNEERLAYIENTISPVLCLGYKSEKFRSFLFAELDIDSAKPFCDGVEEASLNADSVGEILFTTGTTGNPKGVCLSYNNVYASASNINQFIKNEGRDVELLGLPICHSFGLGRIRCNLIKGATLVILGSFANVRLVLKTIEQYHVTGFGVVPAAWAYIRKISGTRIAQYASQIRYIEIGSAAMPMATKQELLQLFPNTRICMHYGLTEASRSVFLEFHDEKHLDSIGKPVTSNVDVQILDSDGNAVPVGQKGEICVKGNMVLKRYLNDDDNKEAFWGNYMRTGDCGFRNDEGYIYLLGREKELINVGGKKVSPMEVEDAICSLGVGDCVCVPMKDESGIMGELVKCYILKDSTTMSFDEIAEGLASRLEFYKRPAKYEWIDSIPKTASGKKQRVNLK
ncbi:long-chain acyl-CoA synthetase [Fibrobacter sp. UWT3]|uniref:class I adenylate-forming enzyme family protein n=1 Tax=Fibrobacter sp. UWT3 TaxID=1896225 RepID=UPI000BD9928F|nr:class I adenylate-forming enzyme family protein [Fibrobacter sp. UWT3]SOE76599.1 long-chain acyl-CoA synthetase [Fibrobacter sp. UWT3]